MRVLLFTVWCTAAYYLIARAEITRWIWQPLDNVKGIGPLLRCPACSGFWLGIVVGRLHPLFFFDDFWLFSAVKHGLAGIVLTAIGFGCMRWALTQAQVTDD